jgi:nucleoid DNA-binding protein
MSNYKVASKSKLISVWAKAVGIKKEHAKFYYEVLTREMLKCIERGEDVILPGIGRVCLIPARSMKSNLTGQHVPPHKRLAFKGNVRLARKLRVATRDYAIR